MKHLTFILFLICSIAVYSQSGNYIHLSTLEIKFSLSDFKNSGQTNNGGLGIAFTEGINNHLDWQLSFNGSYPVNITKSQITPNDKHLLLKTDASIRARLFGRKSAIQPYVLAGIGISKYQDYYGVYIPAGIGIQASIFKNPYVLVNSQYRHGLTNTISNHFYYSFGIAGTIGRKKPAQKAKRIVLPEKTNPLPVTKVLISNTPKDTDNDGILDTADACPDRAGFVKYKGCPVPDTDNDGINDEEDKCITVAGLRAFNGCPPPKREISTDIKTKIDLAARAIYFETGSARLLAKSYAALNEVANILNQDPALKLSIEGHTDTQGKPSTNETLSRSRAQSVLIYLKEKGINTSRLIATGFGQNKPIADNSTPDGRSKNRRVELKLSF